MATMISPHFSKAEAECRCGCGFFVAVPEVIAAMEIIRALAGQPVRVHSWCRCKRHNAAVGGAKDSQHLEGIAVDWSVKGMSPEDMAGLARRVSVFRDGGIGVYSTFVHTDARKTGPARWTG